MVSTVIQEFPTVIFEHDGTLPEEDNETHILVSYIAFNIALVDKPLRISDEYRKSRYYVEGEGKFFGTLEVEFNASHEFKWDQIQEFLLLLNRRTQAVQWYPLRSRRDFESGCETLVLTINVNPSITHTKIETDTGTPAGTETAKAILPGPGAEVVAAYRSRPLIRAFDQHFHGWASDTRMPYADNEVLPAAEDGGPTLEPAPGYLPLYYADYLSIYQKEAQKPLPAKSEDKGDNEYPYEKAVRTRAFYWHCCAWAHYKLGQLVESSLCFDKATATPFNRFDDLQRPSQCPVPGIAPYPDQEYLLWQIGQQLPKSYSYVWDDGNMEWLYWLSMALAAVSADTIPHLARLFSDYLGVMLQRQYYFVANLKTQAFAALISECEAALRQAPIKHIGLYRSLCSKILDGYSDHIAEHPTVTQAEEIVLQNLYDPLRDKLRLEELRDFIQHCVGE